MNEQREWVVEFANDTAIVVMGGSIEEAWHHAVDALKEQWLEQCAYMPKICNIAPAESVDYEYHFLPHY